MAAPRRPNFFLVGAMKCGTTSLAHALRQHPQVFVPEAKELYYFGRDLPVRKCRDLREYLAFFAEAGDAERIGEATPLYFLSKTAAAEIRDFAPEARIVIILRHPVAMLASAHAQKRYNHAERHRDLATALEAERAGETPVDGIRYRDLMRYRPHIERYLGVFGRDRVHVLLLEDLARDPRATYQALCEFLDVDPGFVPDFRVQNPGKVYRSPAFARLVRYPPRALRLLERRLLPASVGERVRQRLLAWNTRTAPPRPVDPLLRRRLCAELREENRRLAELLGRDLSSWEV